LRFCTPVQGSAEALLTRFFPSCYCEKLSWAQCTY
jgi:hypothetical protein